jgi:uncharacterized membrane protein YgdD (TMEM256/DUF423 family)
MSVHRPLAVFAALNGGMGVALGAFAAHGAGPAVKTLLTTGAQYQMIHALLALACALWPARGRSVVLAGCLAAAGGLVFSIALATIGLAGMNSMGAIAPVGGVMMIGAWLLLAFAALRSSTTTV